MEIHHIGYLVDDIVGAMDEMRQLGFEPSSKIVTDQLRQALISFMGNGGYLIELVQPIDKHSPIYGLCKKYKNSPYHVCYRVENIEQEIKKLCENTGYMLISPPQPACAINDAPVAFLMNARLGIIELVES